MIPVRKFATDHSSFWQTHAPALDTVVRTINAGGYTRFAEPTYWNHTPERNYIVNETAFCLSAFYDGAMDLSAVESAFQKAAIRLKDLPGLPSPIEDLNSDEVQDVLKLTTRTNLGLKFLGLKTNIQFDTPVAGCGAIASAAIDAVSQETVIEFKSGERLFRSADFRQAITYCLLANIAQEIRVTEICLFNPRTGMSFRQLMDEFLFDISGKTSVSFTTDFLAAIGMGGPSR